MFETGYKAQTDGFESSSVMQQRLVDDGAFNMSSDDALVPHDDCKAMCHVCDDSNDTHDSKMKTFEVD